MSQIAVESGDLLEWGRVLEVLGSVLARRDESTRLAGEEIQKIGLHLVYLSEHASIVAKILQIPS